MQLRVEDKLFCYSTEWRDLEIEMGEGLPIHSPQNNG